MAVALKLVVVILQLSSIVLLSALLATPARKHPIVNTIIILSVLRSVFDTMPPLLYISKFSAYFGTLLDHPTLARFCVADAIILNYLTVAKAAFATSFTIPCLYLALKFTGSRDRLDADSTPQFYRRTLVALCAGPFVWASPIIFILIPKLAHEPLKLKPELHGPTCTIDSNPEQIAALILMLIPLALSVFTSLLLILILCKHYKLADLHQSIAMLHPIRIARFAALISTIIISATLYSIVLATWVRQRENRGQCLEAWLLTSSTWEAASPLIFFFIFAAQEEVYAMWYTGLRRIIPHFASKCSNTSHNTFVARVPDDTPRHPSRVFARVFMRLAGPRDTLNHLDISQPKGNPSVGKALDVVVQPQDLPGHILPRPCQAGGGSWPARQPGLCPPPRPPRSRDQTPRESAVFRTMPSLSALGCKVVTVHPTASSSSEQGDPNVQIETVREVGVCSENSMWFSSEESRPASAGSLHGHPMNHTGTFGR